MRQGVCHLSSPRTGHVVIGFAGPAASISSSTKHLLGLIGLGVRLIVELLAHAIVVERAFPLRDDHGRDAVADQVGERARLRHEAVDAQDERDAGDRDRADAGQRRRQHDEARAGDAGGALRGQQQDADDAELLRRRSSSVLVACARNSAAIVR